MHDPFPIPPIPWLSSAVQPLADYLGFQTLPLHIHEVLLSFFSYAFVENVVAPTVSQWLFPVKYAALSRNRRLNWNVHVVSLVQSTTINILALWILYADEERKNMEWQERIWGYTGAAGMIQGLAAGYFLWDLMISIIHVQAFGLGMLMHAISALIVFSFGFRPFVNFYGCTFILYELSSPFLNFHWFFDKLGMTGSKAQLYNGFVLLLTFFSCRLVWGTYQSISVFRDIWAALNHYSSASQLTVAVESPTTVLGVELGNPSALQREIMRFAGDEYVPVWLSFIYLSSNLTLNFLNIYWFRQMIITIQRRFAAPKEVKTNVPSAVSQNPSENGSLKFQSEGKNSARKRRKGEAL